MNQNLFAIKIATPYATAFFNLVKYECCLYEITSNLFFLKKLLLTSNEFKICLEKSKHNNNSIDRILEKIFENKLDIITFNFLFWLKRRNRLSFLSIIILLFFKLGYKIANFEIFQIMSAKNLIHDQHLRFFKTFQNLTQSKRVIIQFTTNMSLIDGFLIFHNDKKIDYNIRSRFEKLARELTLRLSL